MKNARVYNLLTDIPHLRREDRLRAAQRSVEQRQTTGPHQCQNLYQVEDRGGKFRAEKR